MKKIRKNLLVALTVIMMVGSTGVGVFADPVEQESVDNSQTTSEAPGDVPAETPADPGEVQADDSDADAVEIGAKSGDVNLQVYPGEDYAWMTWEGEDGAYVIKVSGEGLEKAITAEVSGKTYYKVEGLTVDTTYDFQVASKPEEGADPEYCEPVSKATVANPLKETPVSDLKAYSSYDVMVLEWTPVEGANAYIVWRAANNSSSFSAIRTVSYGKIPNTYVEMIDGKYRFTNKANVVDTKQYRYKVTAVKLEEDADGNLIDKDPSISDIHSFKKYIDTACAPESSITSKKTCVKPMYINVKPKMSRKLTSRNSVNGKKKTVTFKKGVAIKCYGFNSGCYYFKKTYSGKTYTFRIARVNSYGQSATYTKSFNYTRKEAELFVNRYMEDQYGKAPKGSARWNPSLGKDRGTYCIWVSFYTQHTYILKASGKKWVMATSVNDKNFPRDSWESSTGKASTPSYTGNNQINKNRARSMKGIPWWNGYHGSKDKSGNFNGIHGKRSSYKLGVPASHACIRNGNSNAELIYKARIEGTRVICY